MPPISTRTKRPEVGRDYCTGGSDTALHEWCSATASALQQREGGGEGGRGEGPLPHSEAAQPEAQSLLAATSEDLARETVRELKCRLCPGTGISSWEDFKRHCDFMEAHPLKISFCEHCRDFFARSDALRRHEDKPPPTCRDFSPDEAKAKCTATKQAHDAFLEELESLGTSGETWTPFSQRIIEMFPKSKSAKRGSRQQSQIKDPNA